MSSIKKLKKGEVNDLTQKISFYYGCEVENLKKYNFYLNESTNKIYLSSIDIYELDLKKISNFGLYFGTYHDNERLRLSIEGCSFIKPKKNYVKINKENLKSYLAGENLFKNEIEEINCEDNCPFLIVIHENQNIGCISIKNEFLLNYIPKSRRLNFNKVF